MCGEGVTEISVLYPGKPHSKRHFTQLDRSEMTETLQTNLFTTKKIYKINPNQGI